VLGDRHAAGLGGSVSLQVGDEGLVSELGDCDYIWEAGAAKTRWPFRVTYLIGYPSQKPADR